MSVAMQSIPNHYQTAFDINFSEKAQQMDSRLEKWVTPVQFQGERFRCNYMGEVDDPEEITERAGATRISDIPLEARWIYTKAFDKAVLIDQWDEELLGQITLPNSQILNGLMKAFKRHLDSRIVATAAGSIYYGKDGTSTLGFDTTNQRIAVNAVAPGASAADSNLTIEKLIQVKSKFGLAEVDGDGFAGTEGEQVKMGVTQYQLDGLLRTTEIKSADYNTIKALVTGQVNSFMGIDFVRVNPKRLPKVGNVRYTYAWVPSGIHFTIGDFKTSLSIRNDRSNALQVYIAARNGGTRTEEVKVVECLCDETK